MAESGRVSEREHRPGGRILGVLADGLAREAVGVLTESHRLRQAELEGALGDPPRATLRTRLTDLVALGALLRYEDAHRVVYELTPSGRLLRSVTRPLTTWLRAASTVRAPATAAKAAVDAWNAGVLRELAIAPRATSDLGESLTAISHDALRRRIRRLAHTGQLRPAGARGRRRPYELTAWGREAIAPIASATRWEYERATVDFGQVEVADATAALLLAAPLAELPARSSGVCALTAEAADGSGGAQVTVERGRLVGCAPLQPGGRPDAWAHGTISAWLAAVIDDEPAALRIAGDSDLVARLVHALHRRLYA